MKTLILTGGSSGIGKATVELFASKGYRVFELSRHGVTYDNIAHIDCDVTKREDCIDAVKQVVKQTGRVDVLISNAGMGISGAVEFSEIDEEKRQFDVNFFGAVNITQAVLPYMRKVKSGRIIFLSSLAAVFAIPYQSFYSASKSAINALASSLRNEVHEFGISVCCLLPGDVKTGFTEARAKSLVGYDIYTDMNKAVAKMEEDERNGISPERMAKKLLQLAGKNNPCLYNTVGFQYRALLFLNNLIPATVVCRIIRMLYL